MPEVEVGGAGLGPVCVGPRGSDQQVIAPIAVDVADDLDRLAELAVVDVGCEVRVSVVGGQGVGGVVETEEDGRRRWRCRRSRR